MLITRDNTPEALPIFRPTSAQDLLREYLDATRSSLWVLDDARFVRLRACIDEARRWGELTALEAFWREFRSPEDEALAFNWFEAPPTDDSSDPTDRAWWAAPALTPEPPIVLACACTREQLEVTRRHAALPLGSSELLFDARSPAYHRWIERMLDIEWHASFLSAREVLHQLPLRLDQLCRKGVADWFAEHQRGAAAALNALDAAAVFELWSRRYLDEWRDLVVAELEPLAERDAQLVLFTDY